MCVKDTDGHRCRGYSLRVPRGTRPADLLPELCEERSLSDDRIHGPIVTEETGIKAAT